MDKKIIKYIDLFSGIGGFRHGLSNVNHVDYKCVLSCEIDKFARKTYSLLYGLDEQFDENGIIDILKSLENGEDVKPSNHEIFYDDVIRLSNYNNSELNALISYSQGSKEMLDQPYQMLCAGFPCQPFSRSGKRKAFRDENRGNLFFAIKDIIEKTRPPLVILENVKGLLNVGENAIVDDENSFGHGKRIIEIDKGRTFFDILVILVELGYDVEWEVINSNDYLPHKRERVYIFAKTNAELDCIFPLNNAMNFRELTNNQLMENNELGLEVYKVKGEAYELNQLINNNNNEVFNFGSVTPFKNWGRAFSHNNEKIIMTSKVVNSSINNLQHKLEDLLEKDLHKCIPYNLNHINILKQVYSKGPKTVSTGNKMGRMKFPDPVSSPSRTLTATRTLGREIMVVGYFFDGSQIVYVDEVKELEKIFCFPNNKVLSDEQIKLKKRYIDNGIGEISSTCSEEQRIELKVIINSNGVRIEKEVYYYFYDSKSPDMKKNRLFFRTLTPSESWKLQGFLGNESIMDERYENIKIRDLTFAGMSEIIGEQHLLKQAGNAVTTKVITELGKRIGDLIE